MSLEKDKAEELKEVLSGKKGQKVDSKQQTIDNRPETIEKPAEPVADYKDRYLRAVADLENYRKRVQREREDLLQYGNERLLHELVQVLDDFDRVLDHMPENPSGELKQFAEGVEITRRHFLKVMAAFGVKEVEATGKPFDSKFHEAMAHVEATGTLSGTVVDQHRKGYLFHDRLLRPALVTVAK